MFFACGMHQRALMGLVVTALATLLASSCGGAGGSQEEADSAADTTTTTEDTEQATATIEDTDQAPEDALNAALEKSFQESGAPGVVAAVQIPEYTWIRALGVADRAT
jgi:hypothetical protein